jgi:hypothetical protein
LVEAEVEQVAIVPLDQTHTKVQVTLPPAESCAVERKTRQPVAKGQLLHLILEVTDNGTPALTTYRRVLVQATNKDLRGGAKEMEATADTISTQS